MLDIARLSTFTKDKRVHVIVETPRHAAAKFKYDPKLGAFTLARQLMCGLAYPFDWGFVPSTRAEDGDPLDALVIHEVASAPGIVLFCRPIGILEVLQREEGEVFRNDRVFFTLCEEDGQCDWNDVLDMPARRRKEFETFFRATVRGTGKRLEFLGWYGPERAMKLIQKSMAAHKKRR